MMLRLSTASRRVGAGRVRPIFTANPSSAFTPRVRGGLLGLARFPRIPVGGGTRCGSTQAPAPATPTGKGGGGGDDGGGWDDGGWDGDDGEESDEGRKRGTSPLFYLSLFGVAWVLRDLPWAAPSNPDAYKEEIADFVDDAHGIHQQANLPLPVGEKIRWAGRYREGTEDFCPRYFTSNYSLVFQHDGTFEGRGSDADGRFEVKFGRLNPTNGRMGWYEDGSVDTVVTGTYELSPSGNVNFVRLSPPALVLEPSPDSLLCWQSGKYDCKSTGVRDSLSLNCDEGVAVGHQPPQHTLSGPE